MSQFFKCDRCRRDVLAHEMPKYRWYGPINRDLCKPCQDAVIEFVESPVTPLPIVQTSPKESFLTRVERAILCR